jgi:GNAT superfamily N-acetyltransferase
VRRHGAGNAFAVDSGALGLASGGGKPLPDAVRGKMEAALGADFSTVRVHVGPQAERIGAIAFTLGSDIYFAPGRYQPDTVQGQQLLGHELSHVVQQRAGRVRNPLGSGLAVVQDHALEAEADRLGQRAAMHRVPAQAKMPSAAAQPAAPVRISPPISAGPASYRLTAGAAGRPVGSVIVHARDKGAVEVTDLQVAEAQRGHGIGQMLLASAARTGQQFGRSKVTLAAQDNGSGHLTQWYKGMGFAQTGVNQRGYPQLEAPISRVLAGTAQRKVQAVPAPRAVAPPPTQFGPGGVQAKPALSPPSVATIASLAWPRHTVARGVVQRSRSGNNNNDPITTLDQFNKHYSKNGVKANWLPTLETFDSLLYEPKIEGKMSKEEEQKWKKEAKLNELNGLIKHTNIRPSDIPTKQEEIINFIRKKLREVKTSNEDNSNNNRNNNSKSSI